MQDPRGGAPSQELLDALGELLAETRKLMEACKSAYPIEFSEEGKSGIDRLSMLVSSLRNAAPPHIADQVGSIRDLLNAFVLWREGSSDPLLGRLQFSNVVPYAPVDRIREKTEEAKKLNAALTFPIAKY